MATFSSPLLIAHILLLLVITVTCEIPVPHVSKALLSAANPFRDNLIKRTSSDDALLQANLWAGVRHRSSRNIRAGPKTITYKFEKRTAPGGPALISFPNCLFCQGKAKQDTELSVANDFMAEQLLKKMKINALLGQCLFYGQRPLALRVPPNYSLSGKANDYCCKAKSVVQLKTIWHLFPDEGCGEGENYYCLSPRNPICCWLNPLIPGPTLEERVQQSILYFQQMSRAMALTCEKDVYIMLDDPSLIVDQQEGENDSIWLTHELPVLRGLFRQGIVEKLYVVGPEHGADPKTGKDVTDSVLGGKSKRDVEIDWTEPMAKAIKNMKLELVRSGLSRNGTFELAKREGGCGSASDQEDPSMDYFG